VSAFLGAWDPHMKWVPTFNSPVASSPTVEVSIKQVKWEPLEAPSALGEKSRESGTSSVGTKAHTLRANQPVVAVPAHYLYRYPADSVT
jgi:hypothetical protein